MLETSEIEHSHTTIGSAANENVYAVGTESYIKHLLVMSYQLSLRCQRWNIPYRAGCVNA